jgi:replicative DNA helicase
MSDGKKLVTALLERGSVETLRLLKEDILEEDELVLFQWVKNHYRRYQELPTIQTVEQETQTRLPVADESVQFYIKKVYDRNCYVALREEFGNLRESLQGMNIDVSKGIVDRMKSICRVSTPDDDVRNIQEAAAIVMSQYELAHTNPGQSGITCGIPGIDAATGGYQNGDLISWIARMGIGKTYLLILQALAAWSAGYSVLFVTMEMTVPQIVRRMLGINTGINPDFIRRGQLDTYGFRRLKRYARNIAFADRLHIYAGSFARKVSDLEILMHELCPDAVYIDGGYLMQPDNASRNAPRIEKVSLAYDGIKNLTITADRPIITTSQFSRASGKRGKDGSMETISFSDAIGMHSSIVFGVKEGVPPFQISRREIEIMKGREGESGSFLINYGFSPMNFSEITEAQQEAEPVDMDWTA